MFCKVTKLVETEKKTLASRVKDMLFKFGFGYELLAHDVGNSKYLLCLFSQRIRYCYFQDWLARINESPKY